MRHARSGSQRRERQETLVLSSGYFGLTLEAVSRVLAELKEAGIIRLESARRLG